MEKSLLEEISVIIEEGKFRKSKTPDEKLKAEVMKIFNLHKKERTPESAKKAYDAVLNLAEIGKGELAHKFALKFEQEISENDLEGLDSEDEE